MKKTSFLLLIVCILSANSLLTSAKEVDNATVIAAFREHVETVPYLNEENMETLNAEIVEHIKCLQNWSDREAYIKEHDLLNYLERQKGSLQYYQNSSYAMIDDFLLRYAKDGIEDEQACRDSMKAILNDRTGMCETNLNLLDRELTEGKQESFIDQIDWTLVAIVVAALIALIVLMLLLGKKKGTVPQPKPQPYTRTPHDGQGNTAGIVVRRKTATILKKQSLEDVMENPHYLKVDAIDFCQESAVRRLYIKNTCIIDLYNMYAGDLADKNNAKENGCMVLGRWVHDTESNEYYVSLEQLVMPGDDAVFKEYELNFGGKIKLSVLEQLRKLRRDTNMQYDLTCWVHSHPGLSVFFSNSDLSVQMQLKHPTHPNFLTAIVVDTLTPKEDVGIFTFRRDGNINSKNELTRMYSLKEWYQWAQQSLNAQTAVSPQEPQTAKEAPVTPESAAPGETSPTAEVVTPSAVTSSTTTTTASNGANYQYSSN